MRKPQLAIWVRLLLLTMIPATPVQAGGSPATQGERSPSEFGMSTEVFVGDSKEPVVRTTTVFLQGRVYDAVEGGLITRFDFPQKSIELLDRNRNVQTSIAFEDVLRFQADLRARALNRAGLGAFLAAPTFIREFDASTSTIKLSSPWLTYEAKGSQSPSDMIEQFVEFADWSALLGSMLTVTSPPAKARMRLNEALKKQNWQVTRVTRTSGPRARVLGVVRSEHVYREEISAADRLLIQAVEKDLKSFRKISFSEFHAMRNPPRVAAKE